MDHDHGTLRRLFDLAIDAPPDQRAALLDRECQGDAALKERVEAMIAAAEDERFLNAPTAVAGSYFSQQATIEIRTSGGVGRVVSAVLGEGPGSQIGPYKLLQLIGEGGFGSVFMADQQSPVVRKVALKIIKLGMDTRQVIARFEAERQALAMMDHPTIAKIFDASATETGRPYFVMELCKGDPIAAYCDKHNLGINERLELFAQVCQAVQHAHTKGVIHRDIKPSNILVTTHDGKPHAKVIDFGIAKATDSKLTEKTLFTEHRQLIGTPQYMSPEQAEGNFDIDTRTDVYSLGVLLYELLTGSTPIRAQELRSAAFGEIQRMICEVDPPSPSTRLSQSAGTLASVAAARRTEPRQLGAIVRGELDWIVMKALEKNRTRRYETANGLAADIRRYLSGEAVFAAPPSRAYRFRKFVRRNKGPVTIGAAVTVSLLIGVVAFAWQADVARNQRDRAVKAEAESKVRADQLKLVADFQAQMFWGINPAEAGAQLVKNLSRKFDASLSAAKPPPSAEERATQLATFDAQLAAVNASDVAREFIDLTILKPAIATIDQQFNDQPLVDAQLRQTLVDLYMAMGMYEAAQSLVTRTLATRRRLLGDDHPDTIASLTKIGTLYWQQGKRVEAESLYREAYERSLRALGEEHPETLTATSNMGFLLQSQGRMAEAEPFWRETLEKRRRVLGEDHPDTMTAINNVGGLLQAQGKLAEAEPFWREAVEKRRRVLGDDNTNTMTSIGNLGHLLHSQGKLTEAEPLLREALERKRRVLGAEHPETLGSIKNMGGLLQSQGKLTEAESLLLEAVEKYRRVLGAEHPHTLIAVGNLGSLRIAQREFAAALTLLAPVQEKLRTAFTGGNSWRFANLLMNMGQARAGLAKQAHEFAAAEADLLEAHAIFVKTPGPFPKDMRNCEQALADLYVGWDQTEPGKGYDLKAAEWKAINGASSP